MSERISAVELNSDEESQVRYVDLYQATEKIYTRRVRGHFQRLRRWLNWPLMLGFFLLPWINLEGRQAMLFDLSEQRFHILWKTFWPQDGILLAWVLILAAFFLFSLTVWAGRVWCGFACPQTIWTLVFGWIEDRCEGDRYQRIKLDAQPWGPKKLYLKTLKHGLWITVALLTGATFVGYFYGVRELFSDALALQISLEACFWIAVFAGFTYLNAGFLREQFCQYMCPYSRIQSVMYDPDSLVVEYDQERGQHRSGPSSGGDCVNCDWCVQVCPAGIDIRDGLQAECINCGLCVDACDNVMDKLEKPRGLIRFAGQGSAGPWARLLRPRMLGYLTALSLMAGYLVFSVVTWMPLSLDVTRDRGVHLFRHRNGYVENVYTLKLNYKGSEADRFHLSVAGNSDYQIVGRQRVNLTAGESYSLPVRVKVPENQVAGKAATIVFELRSESDPSVAAQQVASFIGPAVALGSGR